MTTTSMETAITARVRDRGGERPWGHGPTTVAVRTVTIGSACPQCGADRGRPVNLNQHDDGVYYSVDVWTNPCGHVDTYTAVLAEAAEREAGASCP